MRGDVCLADDAVEGRQGPVRTLPGRKSGSFARLAIALEDLASPPAHGYWSSQAAFLLSDVERIWRCYAVI